MDERSVRVLEFQKIKDKLKSLASTGIGKELATNIKPMSCISEIQKRQKETTESKAILSARNDISLGGVREIRDIMSRVKIGGILAPSELLDVLSTLKTAKKLKESIEGLNLGFQVLKEHAEKITLHPYIVKEIERCIDNYGNILDDASPELSKIRQQIRSINNRIRNSLDSIVKSQKFSSYLQDPIITLRSGRFVLPVKQESRASIPGIVHDRSASGLTLFIEPMPVVEMNNELASLSAREAQEIEKILKELSFLISNRNFEILNTFYALGAIDFALAKGILSIQMKAIEPEINEKGYLKICQGRHPLIPGTVVPIDIEIGKDFKTLVVTGPNTGGKTVTLKTVGLFTLMTLSGLHLPASSGTNMPVFSQVFADIGDEQSIEQSLSTFSSHMSHIVEILKHANTESLVLLDELGAGTDPREGASLGVAILKYLHERGVITVATTHLSELKVFAYEYEGVENASCEFNIDTLEPTYRLILGLPGGSCALEIAARLGLPEEVVTTAKNYLGEDKIQIDSMIADMERTMLKLELEKEELRKIKREEDQLRKEMETEVRKLKEAKSRILREAKDEAEDMLDKAKADILSIVKKLRKSPFHSRSILDNEARKANEQLKEISKRPLFIKEPLLSTESLVTDIYKNLKPLEPKDIQVGMEVFVGKLRQMGQISWISGEGEDIEIQVQVGGLKVLVSDKDLFVQDGGPVLKESSNTSNIYFSSASRKKTLNVSMEFDVRGKTVEEAIAEVDKYLDDASLAGLSKARIIHGKGTGALRQALREFFKTHHHVEQISPGELSEGGDGVTIVTFSKE